jgi:hypothetical protein
MTCGARPAARRAPPRSVPASRQDATAHGTAEEARKLTALRAPVVHDRGISAGDTMSTRVDKFPSWLDTMGPSLRGAEGTVMALYDFRTVCASSSRCRVLWPRPGAGGLPGRRRREPTLLHDAMTFSKSNPRLAGLARGAAGVTSPPRRGRTHRASRPTPIRRVDGRRRAAVPRQRTAIRPPPPQGAPRRCAPHLVEVRVGSASVAKTSVEERLHDLEDLPHHGRRFATPCRRPAPPVPSAS